VQCSAVSNRREELRGVKEHGKDDMGGRIGRGGGKLLTPHL